MNRGPGMSLIAVLSTILSLSGCENSTPEGAVKDDSPKSEPLTELFATDGDKVGFSLDPTDERIVAFIVWLKDQGITLEFCGGPQHEGEWKLVTPAPPEGRDIIFYLGSFAPSATAGQMREANLSYAVVYQVNTKAHLALAFTDMASVLNGNFEKSDKDLPQVNGRPVTHEVGRQFLLYLH